MIATASLVPMVDVVRQGEATIISGQSHRQSAAQTKDDWGALVLLQCASQRLKGAKSDKASPDRAG